MATEIERLILDISASTKGLERGLNALNKKVDGATGKAERSFAKMNKNILMSTSSMTRDIGGALAAVGVAVATREVVAYADAWTSAKNKLAAAGTESSRMAQTQSDLVKLAIETRTALEPTIDLYAKLLRSTQTLGVSEAAVARATEIVNKSFKAGGAAASEQAAGILQLGQALGSGVLQGDELRSLRENAPLLAKAIAAEFGTTVAGLKKLGEEGKLTSDRVFRAIIKGGADIDAQFGRTESTIGDAFTNLRTRAIEYIGTQNEATGAGKAFIGMLEFMASNMEAFIDATIVGATILGGVFAGQAIASAIRAAIVFAGTLGITTAAITAQGAAATFSAGAVRALSLAMAFFGGPIGIAVAAVAAAIGLIAYEANKSVVPTKALTESVSTLETALGAYEEASVLASTASGEARVKAIEEANALRVVAVEAREAARAKIELARATIAAASARLTELQNNAADSEGMGSYARAQSRTGPGPSSADARQARADAEAGQKALDEADARLNRIDAGLNRTLTPNAPAVTPTGGGSKSKGSRGPTREDIRREAELQAAREIGDYATIRRLEDQIDLKRRIDDYEQAGLNKAAATTAAAEDQTRIAQARATAQAREIGYMQEEVRLAAARAAGDDDLVRSLDRQIEIRDRIREYEELGKTAAEARAQAEADVAAIEEGRITAMNRENEEARKAIELTAAETSGNIELARELQVQQDRRAAIEAYQSRGLDLTQATIAAERDLATIEAARAEARRTYWRDEERAQAQRIAEAQGDVRRARALAREEEIQQRSERYRSEGGLDPTAARDKARTEVDAEAVATARGQFRDAFKDGWRAALDGDFETFLADKAANALSAAAEEGLTKLADFAFDKLAEAFPDIFNDLVGIGGDVAAGATEGATIATAMTTAAATGAATLGAGVSTGSATGGAAMGLAITTASATGAAAMGAAITAAGAAAASAMAAAVAAGGAGGGGSGGAASLFAAFAGTGKAGGGYARAGSMFPVNEFGREGFSPGFNGTIVPADVLRALSQLKPGNYDGGKGPTTFKVENMGEPMTATAREDSNGDMILRLEPIIDRGIENNARKGKLARNLKKSPQPPRSF